MVKRLRLRPLTAATRVRIPVESPQKDICFSDVFLCYAENTSERYFLQDKSAHNEIRDFYAHMALTHERHFARCFCRDSVNIAMRYFLRNNKSAVAPVDSFNRLCDSAFDYLIHFSVYLPPGYGPLPKADPRPVPMPSRIPYTCRKDARRFPVPQDLWTSHRYA